MKLGELRGAIRKTKGNPFITMSIDGKPLSLYLQKTPLLEELDRVFPGGKAVETGLEFDPETAYLDGFNADGTVSETGSVSPEILAQLGESGIDLDTDDPEEDVSTSPLDEDDILV